MSFGRWLLIHSFSIFLVIAFTFGYVFRNELKLEQVYRQLLNIDPKSVSITSSPKSQPIIQPGLNKTETSPTTSVPDTLGSLTVTDTLSGKSGVTAVVAVPEAQPTIMPEVQQAPVSAPISGRELDLQEQLYLARKAYWSKNYAEAIQAYQSLIQKDRSNPDFRGELGNIYYSLNDNDNASRLYYQAAMIFLQQNRPEQARLLLSPIIAMNRELGEDLRMKIQQ